MYLIPADSTTTVVQTVTVTPTNIPNYLVEVTNVGGKQWTGPVVFTLVVAVFAVMVSVASIVVQAYTWRREGAFVKLRAFVDPGNPDREWNGPKSRGKVLGQPAKIRVIAANRGRGTARIGPLFLAIAKRRFCRTVNCLENHVSVKQHGAFPPHPGTTLALEPGQGVATVIDPNEIWWLLDMTGTELSQLRFVTYIFDKPVIVRPSIQVKRELLDKKGRD